MNDIERLDVLLCNISGYSREFAKELIAQGNVFVNGNKVSKAGAKISTIDSKVTFIEPKTKYVSRGGYKLEEALSVFNLNASDKICLDIGASTGGFTDCLLKNNAKKIYAIDSGTDQLHESLQENEKVTLMQKTNIKDVTVEALGELCELATVDVSFISLTKVLQPISLLMQPNSNIIALVKPQFELEQKSKIKNGIIKHKKHHIKVLNKIYNFALSIELTPVNEI
jgi:23S rRNA (cytidine1920-2'-O)/16S rRNA (cytidine1409-2'-O)-methyltransferase